MQLRISSSHVAPLAEMNYTETYIMTGFVIDGKKPSPPNLLSAYSSTDEPYSYTVTVKALQTDSSYPAAVPYTHAEIHTYTFKL